MYTNEKMHTLHTEIARLLLDLAVEYTLEGDEAELEMARKFQQDSRRHRDRAGMYLED